MITARYAAIIRKPGDVMGRDEQENSRTGRMRMQDMVTGLVKQNLIWYWWSTGWLKAEI